MTRFLTFLSITLVCSLQSSFCQTPAAITEKQDPLKDSIDKYQKLGQYAKVLPFAEQWAEKVKKEKGEESGEYGGALNRYGIALDQSGKRSEAEPILLLALKIRKTAFGEMNVEVADSYNSLGVFYYYMAEYKKAEYYLLESLKVQKILSPGKPEIGTLLNNLGNVNADLGNFKLSESYYLQSLEIRSKLLGETHPHFAATLNNLGALHRDMGDYKKAELFYLRCLEIRQKTLEANHPDIAQSLNNLGVLYKNTGKYQKSEDNYNQALRIQKKALGDFHPFVSNTLNNLGILFNQMGSFSKAEHFYFLALEIRLKTLGEEHPNVARSYNTIGGLYLDLKNYPKAEAYFLKALEVTKKNLGETHPDLAVMHFSLSSLYFATGNFRKSHLYLNEVMQIHKISGGLEPMNVVNSYLKTGDLCWVRKDYNKALQNYKSALNSAQKVFGVDHPEMKESLQKIGLTLNETGDFRQANLFINRLQRNLTDQLIRYFPILSEQEKGEFLESISTYLESCASFYASKAFNNPLYSTELFNQQLANKALLLSSSQKFKQRLRFTKDTSLLAKFETWEGLTNRIAKLYSSTDSSELAQLKELETEAETLEKELVRKSEDFATLADKKQYKWTDVQKKLKPGEAAIEMVRVRKYGISKIVTDTSDPKKPTYKVKGLTDTAYYAALIVKPGSKYPEMVLLKNGNALEDRWIEVYKNSIKARLPDPTSYNQFWQKIDAKLGPAVKRVYFSPDGVYNSINLNTLQNPKTGKYLLDERDIRVVTNTKDIVTASISKPNPAYACLVGFPDYNTDKDKRAEVFQKEHNHPEAWYNLNLTRNDAFIELPATKTEVERISGLMQSNGWQVESLLGERALEESIKALQKPRVLHIATHGFFQPDTTKGSNPLIHSGLLLTGANKTLSGEKDDKVDDGILTAYEAMNLNLDNTDLVVLSACETGLGEIKNGEGVYGLQRAFKVAGAKSIIMSLWKVSDQATQELMVSFYKNWLGEAVGAEGKTANSKRSAFLKAQKELKAKYPDPYYWGAFVMVGE
jgi:CHAT domain-containing protein/flagellar motility protein MotE (MotC chaperone)